MAKKHVHFSNLIYGNWDQRVNSFGILACWVIMGAFLGSALAYHLNDLSALNVPESVIAALGGACGLIATYCKTAPVG